jgi:regulator of RNase E activity RraB
VGHPGAEVGLTEKTTMDKVEAKKLQRSMNPKTIQALVEHDFDLSKPHPITNVFYSSDPLFETQLEHELTNRGLDVHKIEMTDSTDDRSEYGFEATIIHSIDVDWIDNLTETCIDLASDCCAEYDGWYTEVE